MEGLLLPTDIDQRVFSGPGKQSQKLAMNWWLISREAEYIPVDADWDETFGTDAIYLIKTDFRAEKRNREDDSPECQHIIYKVYILIYITNSSGWRMSG